MPNPTMTINAISKTTSYTLSAAADIARVSVDFVVECEQQNIIRPIILEGKKHLDADAVRRLVRARHLHQDLGLELTAIDCILRMRRQIISLQKELHEMEKRMTEREQMLLEEIDRLRGATLFEPNGTPDK